MPTHHLYTHYLLAYACICTAFVITSFSIGVNELFLLKSLISTPASRSKYHARRIDRLIAGCGLENVLIFVLLRLLINDLKHKLEPSTELQGPDGNSLSLCDRTIGIDIDSPISRRTYFKYVHMLRATEQCYVM